MRRKFAPLLLASALTACGGGAVYLDGNGGVAFSINGFLDGRRFGDPASAGETTTVTIQVGQSIEFDASSPATWRFSLNGGPFLDAGNSASAGGLSVTVSPVSASGVRVTTTLSGPAALPINLTLSAISSSDSREIATVQLQVR